jgi:hypothetical protein
VNVDPVLAMVSSFAMRQLPISMNYENIAFSPSPENGAGDVATGWRNLRECQNAPHWQYWIRTKVKMPTLCVYVITEGR